MFDKKTTYNNKVKTFRILQPAVFFILLVCLSACSGRTRQNRQEGDTIRMQYAKQLTMVDYGGYTRVEIANPWKAGQVLHTYLLVPKGEAGDKVASQLQSQSGVIDIVRVPVERSIVFTSAHCQLLYYLGRQKAITGVCDLDYINIPQLHACKDIVDCGQSMQPTVEKIVAASPEVLLISPFENAGYGQLEKTGIPIIETADYMETSALGRAEWMKFYGLLFGARDEAEKLFVTVDKEYGELCGKAAKMPKGRSILTERKTGNVWYVPGGESTMGVMLRDANAAYIYSSDKHSGSLSQPVEQILDHAADIDVWAIKYYDGNTSTQDQLMSQKALLQEYDGYKNLKAFQKGEIYECNTAKVPLFEETAFRPELMLRELILLTHPDAGLGELRYYKKLK